MEPSFVKPPSEGKGLGKRGTRKGKNFFPVVIYVLAMAGQDAGAGWNVLAAFWTTGARMLNTSECERERDAWSRHFADTARRHKRSRASVSSAPVADQDADAFVLWHFAEKFSFEPVVYLPKASFKGEQLQNLQKLPQDLCGTLFGKTGVSEVPGNAPMEKTLPRQWSHAPAAYCFKVPEEMARVKHFVTPATFCGTLRITPEEAPPLPLDVSKNKQQFASKQDYYNRGANWGDPRQKRTAVQEILFGQLAFVLPNGEHANEVFALCQRITQGADSSLVDCPPIPGKGTMRRILIKLDLCLMLSRRVFHNPVALASRYHVSRYLSSDASPQARHNFFCTIEEVLLQEKVFQVSDAFNAFQDGLVVEKRSLPALTLGKGEASVAHKARLLIHCACLEYGASSLSVWRKQVVSFLSDQGTERHLPSFPINLEGNLAAFCADFSREPRAGSAEDPLLLPAALSIPGLLHIVFNALEEVISQLPEWTRMEKELSAAAQIVGEPSSQAVVLEKLLGDASPEERMVVHQFSSKLLTWRWESLETVTRQWLAVYPVLKNRWSPDAFSDASAKLVERLGSALASSWHLLFLEWLAMFSAAIGKEASWLEGCFCHNDLLVAQPNRWSRRQALRQAGLLHESCLWQGRRLPALALGHVEHLCRSVHNANSPVLTASLLSASADESRRLVEIDLLCKDGFCRLMRQKLGFFEAVPYVFAGAFGGYCGFSWDTAKAAVGKAICDYDAMEARSRDAVSSGLLENPTTRAQLMAFAQDEDLPLHLYPDAFVAIRSLAYVLCAERRTEGEHAQVKFVSRRGFRYAGPVVIAARKRRLEIKQLIGEHMQWLADVWHSRKIFVNLLDHVLSGSDIVRLTFAERCRRVYACDRKDHFADMSQWEKHALEYNKIFSKADSQADQLALPEEGKQLIYFLKCVMLNGAFVSVPEALWRVASLGRVDTVPDVIPPDDLETNLVIGENLEAKDLRKHVFFRIVEAYPESKVTVKLRHTVKKTTLIHVSYFPTISWEARLSVKINMASAESRILDVSAWIFPDVFTQLCSSLTVWNCTCTSLVLQLKPLVSSSALPLCLPDFVTDGGDELLALGDADAPAELALVDDEAESAPVHIETGDRPPSDAEQKTIMALFEKKAFSEELACNVWDLEYFNTKALDTLQDAGIILQKPDGIGDPLLWITDACSVGPGLQLTNPQLLLEAYATGTCFGGSSKRKTCKVAVLLTLLRDGWCLCKENEESTWFRKNKEKHLVYNVWKRPEAYFRAMLLADLLFDRKGGLNRIHHHAPAAYYTDMLKAVDLTVFAKMSETEILAYASRKKPGTKNKALTDQEQKPEEALVLQVPEHDLEVEPVRCKEPKFAKAKVLYDRYTHSSGNLRCFIQCTFHANCRKYTFVRNHASKNHAEAWLFAWNAMGDKLKTAERHKSSDPSSDSVENFLRYQLLP